MALGYGGSTASEHGLGVGWHGMPDMFGTTSPLVALAAIGQIHVTVVWEHGDNCCWRIGICKRSRCDSHFIPLWALEGLSDISRKFLGGSIEAASQAGLSLCPFHDPAHRSELDDIGPWKALWTTFSLTDTVPT